MSVKCELKKFLGVAKRRKKSGKAKSKRQSRRRTPPRNKNGRFKKRS